jgi:hypothetical protein
MCTLAEQQRPGFFLDSKNGLHSQSSVSLCRVRGNASQLKTSFEIRDGMESCVDGQEV